MLCVAKLLRSFLLTKLFFLLKNYTLNYLAANHIYFFGCVLKIDKIIVKILVETINALNQGAIKKNGGRR